MQPLLVTLVVAAYLGLRSHRTGIPVEPKYLLGACVLLTALLYFPRFL